MPYADPEKRKEVKRLYYQKRYWDTKKSTKFRKEEAARKAQWYQDNKEHCDAKTYARRKAVRAAALKAEKAKLKAKAAKASKKVVKKVKPAARKKTVKRKSR